MGSITISLQELQEAVSSVLHLKGAKQEETTKKLWTELEQRRKENLRKDYEEFKKKNEGVIVDYPQEYKKDKLVSVHELYAK